MRNHPSLALTESKLSEDSGPPLEDLFDEISKVDLISPKKSEPDWLKIVVFPGMLGGLTKGTLDFITPSSTEITMTVIANQITPNSPPPNQFVVLSANIFLGAISAMIGTFVLSDFLDFQKSIRKIFGLSLVFGLSFSLVLDVATSKLSLETEINSLESEKTQLQDIVLNSIINDQPSQTDQKMLLQNIRQLVDQSNNLYVQEKAIQSMALLANRTKDIEIKSSALKCLARIANHSSDQIVQTDVVLAMEAIAMKSNQAALKQRSIEELELLKQNLEPEVMVTFEQAIKHLKS